jgi:hypothetical protein
VGVYHSRHRLIVCPRPTFAKDLEMRLAYPAAAFLLAAIALAGPAKAEDTLYHVTEATVACADAVSVRSLTSPGENRPSNQAAYKSTFDGGRCVSVTPKSPWRFVSRDKDVAMMDYAGTVGPPGSYYFSAAQLVDASGNHPGDASAAAPAGTAPAAAPAAGAPASSETALAPTATPATADTTAAPMWGVTNVLLLAVALLLAGA